MSILLGAVADDFTGATDLANTLVGQGMATVQAIGVPDATFDPGDAAAVVVALKSRTNPAADAVAESRAALAWLRAQGARQIVFKYCSTFDSTDAGNIGPVADALMDDLGTDFTIACPAFPANGRTIYKGYLYVGDVLLSESGMKDHPLTPMTDANLVRVLGRQTAGRVGLVDMTAVAGGADAIAARFKALRADGHRFTIVDAIVDADLMAIGAAVADLPLITGGSGVALGLPENFRRNGLLAGGTAAALPAVAGRAAVLAGSCSIASRGQVAAAADRWPSLSLDPLALAQDSENALTWVDGQAENEPILIYSSADPAEVAAAQDKLGRDQAGAVVERAMGEIARGLVERGVRRLVVAGGETSGAVVQALGVTGLRIGPEIDPGVPWTETLGEPGMALVLKSGNFGTPDFFMKSLEMLP
ncbi:MAG: 3-oxo-tetronate kinase [Rhodospirillaceae bacterium]